MGVASNQTKVNSFCIYEQIVQTQGVCANTQMTNYPSSALTLISVLYHGSWTFSKKCSLPEYQTMNPWPFVGYEMENGSRPGQTYM